MKKKSKFNSVAKRQISLSSFCLSLCLLFLFSCNEKKDKLSNINPEKYAIENNVVQIDTATNNGEILVKKSDKISIYASLENGEIVDYSGKTLEGKPVKGVIYESAKVKRCWFCAEFDDGTITCVPVPCPKKATPPKTPPTTAKGTRIINLDLQNRSEHK